MKPAHLLITIMLAIAALSVTAWLGKSRDPAVAKTTTEPPKADKDDPAAPLPIPEKGPFGKAVAAETTFDFGTIERGDTGSHTFIIKNEGQGPLQVKAGRTSCPQCTIGSVSPANEDIPPGGTAEVMIKWEIKAPASKFRQTASIFTTDPESSKLEFAITGIIDTPLHLAPSDTWAVGDLSETEATVVEGLLFSQIFDDLVIDHAECSNPLVTVTWEKANALDLAEKSGKSGQRVKVSIAPGSAVGAFRETVKLHTTARNGLVSEFNLTGKRSGPLEFKGRNFLPGRNLIRLGEFPAAQGTKANLKLYVRHFDGDLVMTPPDDANPRVKVSIVGSPKTFGQAKVYDVDVEILPGPSEVHLEENSIPVVLKLNHPTANEVKLDVEYYAK